MDKILVISNCNAPVYINVPESRFMRSWPQMGARVMIDKETFDEILYDPGVRYMFETGILYTENLEALKEVGLEDDEATEITNTVALTPARLDEIWALPLDGFKERAKKFSYEDYQRIADWAVANNKADYDKAEFIKSKCGRNILKAIELKKQAEND